MALFTDDFSGHTVGTTANGTATTAITGWTGSFADASGAFQEAEILTSTSPVGTKTMRIADTGYGNQAMMYPTSIGAIAASTATKMLCVVKRNSTPGNNWTLQPGPYMRSPSGDADNGYMVGTNLNGGVYTHQLWWRNNANDWTNVGSGKTVTSTWATGEWWWYRIEVDASGNWQWKSWEDGTSEPGSWDGSGNSTSNNAGFAGVEIFGDGAGNIEVGYLSLATGADVPDEPGGGGGGSVLSSRLSLLGVGR